MLSRVDARARASASASDSERRRRRREAVVDCELSACARLPATCCVPELSPVSALPLSAASISFCLSAVSSTSSTVMSTFFDAVAMKVS